MIMEQNGVDVEITTRGWQKGDGMEVHHELTPSQEYLIHNSERKFVTAEASLLGVGR